MRVSRWDVILKQVASLIALVEQVKSVSEGWSAISPGKDVGELRDQLSRVVDQQHSQATLLAAIAAPLDAIAKASSVAAEKAQQALIVGGIAATLALAALLVALLR